MSRRARLVLGLTGLAVLAGLLGWSVAGLPAFGHYQGGYGNQLTREALAERHVTNVVTAIVFDYRGFDTLGEEFILFASVVGVTLLLRRGTEEEDEQALLREAPDDSTRSDAIRVVGTLAVPVVFGMGLWLVAFGAITPGGGFQGGVLLAGSVLLVFLVAGFRQYKELTPTRWLDFAEGAGAAGFVLLGLGGLVAGAAYLHNFLPSGIRGTLESGGTIPLLNWATAVEVTAAMLLLCSEFLQRFVIPALGDPR
jgi:multicomponent Na+:H+ antiporter subunit B